jgi:hypothetical protein
MASPTRPETPGYVRPNEPTTAPATRTSAKAIGAFVCSIVGLVFLPIVFSLAAIGMGFFAKIEVDNSISMQGRGLAIAAMVIGALGLVLWPVAAAIS